MPPTPNDDRYHRQILLPGFGAAAQEKLAAAKVLVVGAGGLGVPALQYLAGAGVGTLGVMDGDAVGLSNLHRQVIYTPAEIGRSKATLAAAKMTALNPQITVKPYTDCLTPANALDVLRDYDLVVDATDTFAARYCINDACVLLGLPFVYGAAQQYEGHLSVFNFESGPTYRCLYPEPPAAGQIPDCNTGGILGVVPGLIGCYQALEAIKVLTGIGRPLSGTLQVFDFRTGEQYSMALHANPANKRITALQESYAVQPCEHAAGMTKSQLQEWREAGRPFTLLDVREPGEFAVGHLPGAQNVPLPELQRTAFPFEATRPLVLYCQKGPRSIQAAQLLQERQPGVPLYVLTGGYDAWNAQLPAV